MKNNILAPEVQDVIVAAVPRPGTEADELWDVYVVNLKDEVMDTVLITSQGYGTVDGEDVATTVLRHFHEQLPAGGVIKIEPIQASLFGLKNEYWVSFNAGGQMLDKKFIFAPGAISHDTMVDVPVLGQRGVMIR